jgi:hypothetical protein
MTRKRPFPVRAGFLGALACLAAFAPAARAAAEPPIEGVTRRYTLAIGSHEGGPGRERLLFADADARAFRKTLEEVGGQEPGDATLLVDPDSAALLRALDGLAARVRAARKTGAHTEALVYYSGHADENGLLLGRQSLDYREFRKRMNGLGADVRIAVLDACASGALTRMKGGRAVPAFMVDKSSRSEGYAFLTSSSGSEASQESDQLRGSYFTHALNTGLRGAADASRDGKVTLHEAYQFAYHETLERTESTRGGPQHAGYEIQLTGSGDVVLTDLRAATSSLVLSEDLNGRLFIRDSLGGLLAELEKPAGREMNLGLAPGAYDMRLLQGASWSEASTVLREGKTAVVAPASFRLAAQAPPVAPVAPASASADSDGFHHVPGEGAGGFSASVLYDTRGEPWHGTQLAFGATNARSHRRGTQLAIGFNATHGDLKGFQGSVFVNAVGGSHHGFQLSGINVTSNDMRGFQFSPLMDVVGGRADGAQISGLLGIAGSDLKGLQLDGLLGISGGSVHGIQVSGLGNVASDSLAGMQLSGLANMAGKNARGAQGAGLFNFSREDFRGVELAGLFNVAGGEVSGAQMAGLANSARKVRGLQFAGLLNVAGEVSGTQIGLVNLSNEYKAGAPFGLVNISRKGRLEAESWAEETGLVFTGLRTGAGWMRSQFALGVKPRGDRRMLAPTFGLAGEYAFSGTPLFMETGLLYSTLITIDGYPLDHARVNADWGRLRAGLGIRPLSFLTIVGGLSYNAMVHPFDDTPYTGDGYRYLHTYGDVVSLWPGAWAGIRIGK